MMKAYKIEVFVIDHDELGEENIKIEMENVRYPNRCLSPDVKKITCVDIGKWDDDHPLNQIDTCDAEYERLFNPPQQKSAERTAFMACPECGKIVESVLSISLRKF